MQLFVFLLHMSPYKHLFFDLDNTLVDFRANAREAFQEIFIQLGIATGSFSLDEFLTAFYKHNERFWVEYRNQSFSFDWWYANSTSTAHFKHCKKDIRNWLIKMSPKKRSECSVSLN